MKTRALGSSIRFILVVLTCVVTASFITSAAGQSVAAAAKHRREASASTKQQSGTGEISGKVIETMDGGGYTYVRIETSAGEIWAAIPQTAIKVGSPLKLHPQVTIEKFESKALKRTFDRIVFATVPDAPAGDAAPHATTGTSGDATAHMSAPDAEVGRIEKPASGRTVAELWSLRTDLRDSEVIVRGKVVKSVLHVMGRNWIHLRDGSGSRADGTDDITITTSEEVPAGEIATFRGTLSVDKDYGGGYRYAVIVEAATRIR